MKRPQTKFHAHAMKESWVIKSKKVKISHYRSKVIVGSKFSCKSFFSLSISYWNYDNRYGYAFASLFAILS